MKRIKSSFWLAAGLTLCTSALQAQNHERRIEAAESIGNQLFMQDRAVARATDRLRECCNLLETERLAGWIVDRPESGRFLVTYVVLNEDQEPEAKFRVNMACDGSVVGEPEALETPEPLTGRDLAQFKARILAMQADVKRCDGTYNTVALPHGSGDDAEWTIYMLRSTTQHGVIPVGTHYRFRINADGSRILDDWRFTNACLMMPTGEPPQIPYVTHFRDPVPNEVHVFLALFADRPLAVGISEAEGDKPEVWMVNDGKIRHSKDLTESILK